MLALFRAQLQEGVEPSYKLDERGGLYPDSDGEDEPKIDHSKAPPFVCDPDQLTPTTRSGKPADERQRSLSALARAELHLFAGQQEAERAVRGLSQPSAVKEPPTHGIRIHAGVSSFSKTEAVREMNTALEKTIRKIRTQPQIRVGSGRVWSGRQMLKSAKPANPRHLPSKLPEVRSVDVDGRSFCRSPAQFRLPSINADDETSNLEWFTHSNVSIIQINKKKQAAKKNSTRRGSAHVQDLEHDYFFSQVAGHMQLQLEQDAVGNVTRMRLGRVKEPGKPQLPVNEWSTGIVGTGLVDMRHCPFKKDKAMQKWKAAEELKINRYLRNQQELLTASAPVLTSMKYAANLLPTHLMQHQGQQDGASVAHFKGWRKVQIQNTAHQAVRQSYRKHSQLGKLLKNISKETLEEEEEMDTEPGDNDDDDDAPIQTEPEAAVSFSSSTGVAIASSTPVDLSS